MYIRILWEDAKHTFFNEIAPSALIIFFNRDFIYPPLSSGWGEEVNAEVVRTS
jgi:hypothetical protein